MIYLITGVPGSGKSLYAVGKLLQELLKQEVQHDDGTTYKRRLVVDNIPNLLLPHEPMASGALVKGHVDAADGHGLWNWHVWCKPGDIIVSDEVQRHWRPRGMGVKVPEDIAMLETHRHSGVDFVLITQNAMLLDQNVRRLVGRHTHVRRIFGGARALLYDWDGCQTDTTRTQGATRSLFTYPRDAFKLYKSSELHTKQKQKVPFWFAFPIVVVALAAVVAPKAYDVMYRSTTGKGLVSSAPVTGQPTSTPNKAADAKPSAASAPVAAASSPPGAPVEPAMSLIGCISFESQCTCYATTGYRVKVERAECEDSTQRTGKLVPLLLTTSPTVTPVPPSRAASGIASIDEGAVLQLPPHPAGKNLSLPQAARSVL
jgi:zona occludens toxin